MYSNITKRRRLTAILAASLLTLQAPAVHAKCKFQTDGINQFTNESVRWSNWTMLKMILTDPYLMVTAITENERKYLGLRLHVGSSQSTRPTKADVNNAVVVSEGALSCCSWPMPPVMESVQRFR